MIHSSNLEEMMNMRIPIDDLPVILMLACSFVSLVTRIACFASLPFDQQNGTSDLALFF